METKDFNQTPLFQLNLLIYLCWDSGNYVKPIFHENGFDLFLFEKTIPVNPITFAKANGLNPPLSINKNVSPDLIIRNESKKMVIPIECKGNSFGPDSNNSKQACALLTFTGEQLGQFFGFSNYEEWKSSVIYVVGEDKSSLMLQTLKVLAKNLQEKGFAPSITYSLEISIETDGIYLKCPSEKPCTLLGIDQPIKIMNLESGETPSLLYLLPIDPDVNLQSEYEQLEFRERIRSSIASLIGMRLDQRNFTIAEEDLYKSIIEVWDYWGNLESKKRLRTEIGKYLNKVISELRKLGLIITREGKKIICKNVKGEVSRKVRNYFMSDKYLQGIIEIDFAGQLPFDFYYAKTISSSHRRR